jgi:2-keto-4-pentenoate hydratase/2-oxohepta-3-ene-1,7-dioic acid hydratase in catechol pathway
VTYRAVDGWRVGAEFDGAVVDLEAAGWNFGGRLQSLRSLLESGQSAPGEALALAAERFEAGDVEAFDGAGLEIGPPIPDPQKILCIGANYKTHLSEADMDTPEFPEIFAKTPNVLIGPEAPIPVTPLSAEIDWEGELALVIGKRCRNVSREDALGVVAGYSVFNDVSARDIQLRVSQWVVGKSLDGMGPMGPGLVLADDISDPQTLELETRLNGEVVQHANTSLMIIQIDQAIEYLTSFMTLEPGDIIATGTCGGVGLYRDPPLFMADGDVVEVEVEQVGVLRNPVAAVIAA